MVVVVVVVRYDRRC